MATANNWKIKGGDRQEHLVSQHDRHKASETYIKSQEPCSLDLMNPFAFDQA